MALHNVWSKRSNERHKNSYWRFAFPFLSSLLPPLGASGGGVQIFATAGRSQWCCLFTEAPTWKALETCSTPASSLRMATWSWWPWTTGSASSVSDAHLHQTNRVFICGCWRASLRAPLYYSFCTTQTVTCAQRQMGFSRQTLLLFSELISQWRMTSWIGQSNDNQCRPSLWLFTFWWILFVD